MSGLDALAWLAAQGIKFCRVAAWNATGRSPGKRPLEMGWPDHPHSLEDVLPHVRAGGNVGMLCGPRSANIGLLDVDRDFQKFLELHDSLKGVPAILRGQADKGKLLIRVNGPMPASQKWFKEGVEGPVLEWLGQGCQGIVPPSRHPSGDLYRLENTASPIHVMTPDMLNLVFECWGGSGILEEDRDAPGGIPPRAHRRVKPGSLKAAVLSAWDPLKVFQHFGWVKETRLESGGEWLRLRGNGGLFVHLVDGKPDTWAMPGQNGNGGGIFEAWQFCKTGHPRVPHGEAFFTLVLEMALAAGLPLVEAGAPVTLSASQLEHLGLPKPDYDYAKSSGNEVPIARRPSPAQRHFSPHRKHSHPPEPRPPHSGGRFARKGSAHPPDHIPDDDELAARWQAAFPLTAWGLGAWRRYRAGCWPATGDDHIAAEIRRTLEQSRSLGVRLSSSRVASVLELARLRVARDPEDWDRDPHRLVLANGTLHLPTRHLALHNPADLITGKLDFDYDPGARAPVFRRVLEEAIPEAAAFLQEFSGYCLTTDTRYELAVWLFGPMGSGKSTILEGLQAMLGLRVAQLGLADIERSRFALGDLQGKTLAIASEQPASYMQATHLLNRLISGERVVVERKYQHPVTFIPRLKLLWAMNELPRLPDAANGLFRRVKVIRFPELSPARRDPQVKEKVKLEGPGIFNWALDGLARLRSRGGFAIPTCVEEATGEYRQSNDIPELFVKECCEVNPDHRTQSQALYNAYRDWCERNGHHPKSSTQVAVDWERLGFKRSASGGRRFWEGVGLVAPLPALR